MKHISSPQLQQARQQYEAIPIPPQLSARLEQTIAQHTPAKSRPLRRIPVIAAACLLTLLAFCNLQPTAAQAVADVPVVGQIVRVLTVQSWQQQGNAGTIAVNQPALEDDSALAQSVNAQIDRIVAERTAEAEQRLEEYRQAFLATGGTEAQWAEHDLHVQIDYQIFCQNQRYLSFVVTSVEDWSNAYTEAFYYNLDMQTKQQLTLQDLLGDDYIQIANAEIRRQMDARMAADPDITYFDADLGGFTSIDETTPFFISENGNPVIVFDRYTIAPGFMGAQQFEVPVE